MKLADKTAFITGGGRGIGRAIAAAFAREGARVFVVARTGAEVARVAAEIRAECGAESASHGVCDVADPRSVARAFGEARAFFGRGADILVNNAGIAESAKLTETTDEFWQRHLAVNLSGTFHCMRAALPSMIERGWGRVVNVASIAGKTGAPYIAAYSASKHGVLGLTRSAALEVAAKGVTVNAVCPGYVDTLMTARAVEHIEAKTGRKREESLEAIKRMSPQNRLITSEEVAAVALLLASEAGRGITGQAINVDGGTVLF
ncbi:MAG TPA: SDR family NAD(P)-dependent oxidoreductase [Pyrinomonadaceae bacterium]|jgi:NAD(P)-dependent dehydrogenase (short-subunit alcohol dehydrogenase family)|nr:SDR family NAD(P)-dependent oxidoreductase [Pyrinomonadaceae bacterium]